MDIRDRIRSEIRQSGTRVDKRLELLDLVFSGEGVSALQRRLEESEKGLSQAIDQLRKEAMGR